MAQILNVAARTYRSEGLETLARRGLYWGSRILARPLEPLYQRWKPTETTLNAGGSEAVFDMTPAYLSRYDFRDDFRSERQIIEQFVNDIESDDIVWDVGANVGLYALFAAEIAQEVLAIEPHPVAYDVLENNVSTTDGTVASRNVALSNVNDTTRIPAGMNSLLVGPGNVVNLNSEGGYTVETRRANALSAPTPSVVKIDVEGAEQRVIEGFDDMIDDVRLLYCEIHDGKIRSFGSTTDEFLAELENHFDITVLRQRNSQRFVRCIRND